MTKEEYEYLKEQFLKMPPMHRVLFIVSCSYSISKKALLKEISQLHHRRENKERGNEMKCPKCGAEMVDVVFGGEWLWLCPECDNTEDYE